MDSTIPVSSEALFPSRPRRLTQYIAAISVTVGGLAMGTCLSWTSPTEAQLEEWLGAGPTSWVAGAMPLGGAAAVLPMGWAMDVAGRKPTLLCVAPFFVGGWLLLLFAKPLWMFLLGRFVCGLACGAFSLIAPVYATEIADDGVRGMLGGFFQLMLTVGLVFVYALGALAASYTLLTALCAAIPVVFAAVFAFMPETPQQLLRKGREGEARRALQWLRGPHFDVEKELLENKEAIERVQMENVSFRQAFRSRAAQKGLVVAMGLMVFMQMSGINAVIFFTATIFEEAGTYLDSSYCALITGFMQVASTFASGLVVDRLGRRLLLLLSAGIMCLCAALLGLFFFLKDGESPAADRITWLPLVSLCVFNIVFALGLGPIPWMMLGELFPPNTKGVAGPIACIVNWLLSFVVAKFFSDMRAAMGTGPTFWFFSGVSAVGTIFVLFIVPETKGKSLQEIQEELAGGKNGTDESEIPNKF